MTALYRAVLVAAFAAAFSPRVAAAQKVSSDSLLRRIDSLERRVVDLEGRVGQLEGLLKAEPARAKPIAPSGNWRDVANWRRLKRGMNADQVRALLGEPEGVVELTSSTIWSWGESSEATGMLRFDGDRLSSWFEPNR